MRELCLAFRLFQRRERPFRRLLTGKAGVIIVKLLWTRSAFLYLLLRNRGATLPILDKVTKSLQTLTKLFDFPVYIGYNNVVYVSVAMKVDIYGSKRA